MFCRAELFESLPDFLSEVVSSVVLLNELCLLQRLCLFFLAEQELIVVVGNLQGTGVIVVVIFEFSHLQLHLLLLAVRREHVVRERKVVVVSFLDEFGAVLSFQESVFREDQSVLVGEVQDTHHFRESVQVVDHVVDVFRFLCGKARFVEQAEQIPQFSAGLLLLLLLLLQLLLALRSCCLCC